MRDCAAVGLIVPERTPDARDETFGEVWRGDGNLAINRAPYFDIDNIIIVGGAAGAPRKQRAPGP